MNVRYCLPHFNLFACMFACTFLGKNPYATHGLVCMICGIFTRWKQIVAYYYTPDGFTGAILKEIILKIIEKAENLGLLIHSITSDMGGVNQAMWKAFENISANKYSIIKNSVPHPLDNNRKLFFFADAPHLLKNLRTALVNNKIIILPQNFAEMYELSSCIVKCSHVEELVAEQENLTFKLAPKLDSQVVTITNFNKMRVNKATALYNRDVSSALQFIAKERNINEYKVTALFIEIVSKWFNMVTSRTSLIALGRIEGEEKSHKKFDESIKFLKSIIDLFCNIKIGVDGKFKPVQCGIMLTTTSFIELTNYLINERGYLYVLGARFTQDCVENLFSNIRKKFPVPNALQFKQCLKIHSVSQYLQVLPNTNYEQDEGPLLVNFLKKCQKDKNQNILCEIPVIPTYVDKIQINMDNVHLNVLYSLAGYIIHKISKLSTVCKTCIDSAGSRTFDANIKYSKLVHFKCFRSQTLFFVNTETYNYFYEMEVIIRRYLPYIKNKNCNLITVLTEKMANIRCDTLGTCCNLYNKIMKHFITFRIKIDCKKGRLKTKIFSSKTMAMHSTIK